MKKCLLFLFLINGILCFSQTTTKIEKKKRLHKLVATDSILKRIQHFKDSAATVLQFADSNQIRNDISRNMDGILRLQREQKAKQKKAATIRIAIGVALFVVLIIGLKRRRK